MAESIKIKMFCDVFGIFSLLWLFTKVLIFRYDETKNYELQVTLIKQKKLNDHIQTLFLWNLKSFNSGIFNEKI